MTHWAGVRLVAGREIRERLRSKVFRISTIISGVVVAALLVVPSLLSDDEPPVYDVGLVGHATPALISAIEGVGDAVGGEVRARPVESVALAERQLKSGALDVAVVDAASIVVNDPLDPNRLSGRLRLVVVVSETVRLQT
ncbi:MAG TPA: hypothetical protein VNB24_10600, partial [Acidimicrobiales bacterium]|nr:hypothetical protein [Acidimicrobiales bacterium]